MAYTATQFTAGFVQCGVSETGCVCCLSGAGSVCDYRLCVCVCVRERERERERETIDCVWVTIDVCVCV